MAGTNPLNPYVRLIKNPVGEYVLEVMYETPQSCLTNAVISMTADASIVNEINVPAQAQITFLVTIELDPTDRENSSMCACAQRSIILTNLPANASGGILVNTSWRTAGENHGPETPGKSVLQFEDALDQR